MFKSKYPALACRWLNATVELATGLCMPHLHLNCVLLEQVRKARDACCEVGFEGSLQLLWGRMAQLACVQRRVEERQEGGGDGVGLNLRSILNEMGLESMSSSSSGSDEEDSDSNHGGGASAAAAAEPPRALIARVLPALGRYFLEAPAPDEVARAVLESTNGFARLPRCGDVKLRVDALCDTITGQF